MLVFASRSNVVPNQPHTRHARIVTGFGDVDDAPARATLALRLQGLSGLPAFEGAANLVADIYVLLPSGAAAAPARALATSVAVPIVAGMAHLALRSLVKDAAYELCCHQRRSKPSSFTTPSAIITS